MNNVIVTDCKVRINDVLTLKGRKYKVEGIRYIAVHGEYYTNTSIVAEIWVSGKRNSSYKAFIWKSGNIELMDQLGSTGIAYRGVFGYDGINGTTFAAEVI